jgi:hypothetical protein
MRKKAETRKTVISRVEKLMRGVRFRTKTIAATGNTDIRDSHSFLDNVFNTGDEFLLVYSFTIFYHIPAEKARAKEKYLAAFLTEPKTLLRRHERREECFPRIFFTHAIDKRRVMSYNV